MTPRRTVFALVPLVALLAALLTGCGGDNGQAAALEACKAYTDGVTGVVDSAQRGAALDRAENWARKAATAAPQWQPLVDALDDYRQSLHAGAGTTKARHLADEAHRLINASCEAAAKGF